jgi:hypothetical protein
MGVGAGAAGAACGTEGVLCAWGAETILSLGGAEIIRGYLAARVSVAKPVASNV